MLWNVVQFQAGWFALVLGAANGLAGWGMAAVLVFTAHHLWACGRPGEWRLLALVTLAGGLWETLVFHLGLLIYPGYGTGALLAPPWMALLWLNFATTLYHSLAWLRGQWWLAALLGGVGGPLAFLAGAKLGAVVFADTLLTTLFLAAAWAVLTPLVFWLADRLAAPGDCVIGSVLEVGRG